MKREHTGAMGRYGDFKPLEPKALLARLSAIAPPPRRRNIPVEWVGMGQGDLG